MAPKHLARLRAWGNILDACIRCGYCFEQCPIYKHTRWESDSPRSKLVMASGLVRGDLEPSAYLTEKFFECYFCKRCADNCSGGVPLTDIFADARADLIEAGYGKGVGTTSQTDPGRCALCLACLRNCKHEARFIKDRIITDRIKCQGCGVCLDTCPRGAVTVKSFGTGADDLLTVCDAFLADDRQGPKAIICCCNWSSFPGLQNSVLADGVRNRSGKDQRAYQVVVNICAGRLQMPTLWAMLQRNAWGVLVTVCPDGECEHDGNIRARARVDALRAMLPEVGLHADRIRLVEIPKGGVSVLCSEIDGFMSAIRSLGPVRVVQDKKA